MLCFYITHSERNGQGTGRAQKGTKMENLIRLPLQYFAEDVNGAGTSSAEANGDGQATGGEGAKQDTPPTFDELLKSNKEYQAEVDRRISKSLETARKNWEAEKQEALTEQEKLAKMKADEKAQYEREKAEAKLKEREAEITRRELMASAKETLIEKELPAELASVINYTNADTCKESLDALEVAFKAVVANSTNDKLRSKSAPKTGGGNNAVDPFLSGLGLKQ